MDKTKSTLRGFKYAFYTLVYQLVHVALHGFLKGGPEMFNHDLKPQ